MSDHTKTQGELVEREKTGDELRDEGIAAVLAGKAEYVARFNTAAMELLNKLGSVNSDQVVDKVGLPPGSSNAVGGAIRRFALANRLKIVGFFKSKRPSRHSGRIAIWARSET